jgi:hypothetical protein
MHPARLRSDGVESQNKSAKYLPEVEMTYIRVIKDFLCFRVLKPVAAQPSEVHKHGEKESHV